MKLRNGDKVLKPVHPNAGIEAEYRRKLDALIEDMQASYERWVLAQYRATPPALAQDAAPKRVTAVEARVGESRFFTVYVDGVLLRKPNGSGRTFRSRAAAEVAGLKEGGAAAQATVPIGWEDQLSPDILRNLPIAPTPAEALEEQLANLGAQWEARFATVAPKLGRWFATATSKRSTDGLRKILRDGGVSVRFDLTKEMRDAYAATAAENVGLIKSIASQYHTEVQGMVMRSVTAGRDVGMLTRELEHRYGVTRRRAAGIALDQNNKATSVFVKVRQTQAKITEALWLHSHGGKEPRKTHLANTGKPYNIVKGWYDPDPRVKRFIHPGELIKCRCVSRSIVRGFS